ncbi:hypothetical protein HYV58_00700 [Candidatus Peregrinibacteria bacterium]|nr:hypothetical protein [Candidatus Peregrinibacteria bacterium]
MGNAEINGIPSEGARGTHQPSRKQALVFFFLSLTLAGAIGLWTFVFNKGSLQVEAIAPFRVSAGGVTKECLESPCIFELTPKTYKVRAEKEGYFEDIQTVEIKRGEKIAVAPAFHIIPVVKALAAAPKMIEEVGEKNVAPKTEGSFFLETSESGQILKRGEKGKEEVAAVFERAFKNPALIASPSDTKVLIIDAADDRRTFYLVDAAKKSLHRLAVSPQADGFRWAGEYLIFEEKDGESDQVFRIHTDQLVISPLPASDAENVILAKSGNFVFFADAKQEAGAKQFGPAIGEVLDVAEKELNDSESKIQLKTKNVYLTELDVGKNVSFTLATVTLSVDEKIDALLEDPEGGAFYFEKSGKWFEVTTRE